VMLSSELLSAPLLDHRGLDLDAASRVTYVLQQSFRYDYDKPVRALRQRLVIVPRSRHGNQYRRAHTLEVDGAQAERRVRRDCRGNVVTALLAEHVARSVEFRLAAILERIRDDGPVVVPRAALASPGLLRPTRLTAADDRLRELARELTVRSDTPLERAERICGRVHAAMTYRDGVTSVQTPAAEALAGREATAVAFDPCNGCRGGSGYLTVATGRDYSDVAPTSGSYVGTSRGRLTADRRVGVLAAA